MKMKLKLYESRDLNDLHNMLIAFSEEVFECGTVDINDFIDSHSHIYLAIIRGEVVGFTSFYTNTYFGLRPTTVGNTYVYVKPEHRRSKALHLMSIQSGLVARDLNMPLEHYVASDASRRLTSRLKGKELYTTFIYELDEVNRVVDGLTRKVKVEQ